MPYKVAEGPLRSFFEQFDLANGGRPFLAPLPDSPELQVVAVALWVNTEAEARQGRSSDLEASDGGEREFLVLTVAGEMVDVEMPHDYPRANDVVGNTAVLLSAGYPDARAAGRAAMEVRVGLAQTVGLDPAALAVSQSSLDPESDYGILESGLETALKLLQTARETRDVNVITVIEAASELQAGRAVWLDTPPLETTADAAPSQPAEGAVVETGQESAVNRAGPSRLVGDRAESGSPAPHFYQPAASQLTLTSRGPAATSGSTAASDGQHRRR